MHTINTKEIIHAFTVVKIPISVPTPNVKDYSHSAESDPGTLQRKDTPVVMVINGSKSLTIARKAPT